MELPASLWKLASERLHLTVVELPIHLWQLCHIGLQIRHHPSGPHPHADSWDHRHLAQPLHHHLHLSPSSFHLRFSLISLIIFIQIHPILWAVQHPILLLLFLALKSWTLSSFWNTNRHFFILPDCLFKPDKSTWSAKKGSWQNAYAETHPPAQSSWRACSTPW